MTEKLTIILVLILYLILSSNGFSQSNFKQEIIDGQLIIMPAKDYTIQDVVNNIRESKIIEGRIKVERNLSSIMNTFLISYDYKLYNQNNVLEKCKNLPTINIVQFNHVIHNRLVPNDTYISDQWQYDNTGNNGGVVDADIDAVEAWNTTTGGQTYSGDTIVVCIIDDGIESSHPDFGSNRWYNYSEIPNNGIDDDNNGYVDDYYGWDANNNSAVIPDGFGHGTSVAGIVGAKGNNGIGVSGVNWDVKLMIVSGGGNEAQAITAYSYPLKMRKMYNESNGQNGAFVVATNASWGIDYGQPSSSPLWCAMYDTLGSYGILNTGATANNNVDVDVYGDLPSACGSDYLVSVTNTDHTDTKVTNAGYGATTIDIGAPGEGTFTTTNSNSYGGFGGTSGATPHVTGVIALLYSVQCPNFMILAKSNPSQAALLIKDYILNGGDPNSSLSGITVSGNRLNAKRAIDLMTSLCSSLDTCYTPIPFALNTSETTTDISWTNASVYSNMDLRYREVGEIVWTTLYNVSSPYTLGLLSPCTEYEFELEATCDTLYVASANFNTLCCDDTISASSISVNSNNQYSLINWTGLPLSITYNVRYRALSSSTWIDSLNLSIPSIALYNLLECTDYEIQVESVCSLGTSGYSSSKLFTTFGCGPCRDSSYCEVNNLNTQYEWINNVNFNTINNSSGNNGGYGDFLGNPDTLIIGQTYNLSITPGFSDLPADEYINAWIDYNQDGDFDDPNELIFSNGPVQTTTSESITIPTSSTPGLTRMRIAMKWNSAPIICSPNSYYGETEDYCVFITSGIGIIENDFGNDFTVYPNPTKGEFSVDLASDFKSVVISISSINGKLISSKRYNEGQIFNLKLEELNGVYLLIIESGEKKAVIRLVKE